MDDQKNPKSFYEVGYGKPPKSSQFNKGKSGNPKGRRKGSKNLATFFTQDGKQTVWINGPNGKRPIPKIQGVVTQLGNQAAQGNLAAARLYLLLFQSLELREQGGRSALPFHEMDNAVIQNLVKRIQKLNDPSSDDGGAAENTEESK